MSLAEQIAKILLEIKAVTLNVKQPYRYTSGILSPIYCDNRLVISYPEKRQQVIQAFIQLIENQALEFDVVAGTATAGIPHAAWIAEHFNKPMVYVRGKAKGHGKQNQIEGHLTPGQKALVIEDLVSTGGSSVDAGLALRDAGATVTDCLAIFTYQLATSIDAFQKAEIKLHTLTNFPSLLGVAVNEHYISEAEKNIAAAWNQDPNGWEKKFDAASKTRA